MSIFGYNGIQTMAAPPMQNIFSAFANASELSNKLESEKYNNAILQAQAGVAPQMSQAELLKAQLGNSLLQTQAQYLPQEKQAQIALTRAQAGHIPFENQVSSAQAALLGAQTQRERVLADNPLLSLSGPAGGYGAYLYLKQHYPNMVVGDNNQPGAMPVVSQQGGTNSLGIQSSPMQNGSYSPMPQLGQQPQNALAQPPSPMAQQSGPQNIANALLDTINQQNNAKLAQAALAQKRTQGYNYQSMPVDYKSAVLAQAQGMGYSPNDATQLLMEGHTLEDMAKAKGFDPNSMPEPIYPTSKQALIQIQKRQQALNEINALNPILTQAMAPYSRRFAGYSPAQISQALQGEDEDSQARYLAAQALTPEMSSLRLKTMGGQVGIEAIREVTNSSMGNIKSFQSLVSPSVYTKANQYIDQWLNDAVTKANNVGLQTYGKGPAISGQTQGTSESSGTGDTIKVKMPDGSMWNIPPENLDKALKRGAQQVD